MANRVITAKTLKMKRQGRRPRFSGQMISTGQGPDPVRMQEYYNRVKSWGEEIPKTLGLNLDRAIGPNAIPRAAVICSIAKLLQETPPERHVVLINNQRQKLIMMFSIGNSWFFVHEDKILHVLKRSITYGSRERALLAERKRRIVWVEQLSIAPSDSPS